MITMAAAKFTGRQAWAAISRYSSTHQFAFSAAFVVVIAAKLTHIYAHLTAVDTNQMVLWGPSFFFQDSFFLFGLKAVMRCGTTAILLTLPVVTLVVMEAAISISFYLATGTELQWDSAGAALDNSSRESMLIGLVLFSSVVVCLLVIAAVLQTYILKAGNIALDMTAWPVMYPLNRLRRFNDDPSLEYEPLILKDNRILANEKPEVELTMESQQSGSTTSKLIVCIYVCIGLALAAQVLGIMCRPKDSSLILLSWTILLVPLVDLQMSTSSRSVTFIHSGSLTNVTALTDSKPFPWLPEGKSMPGFEDWYEDGAKHYNADADPLKLSNLDDGLLPDLRNVDFSDVAIRHIILVAMKNTRKDVFPIKRNGTAWTKLAETYEDGILPEKLQENFASLTPNARFITGGYDDGFDRDDKNDNELGKTYRGGVNANNVHTTSTYTLKNLAGTHCGLSPLTADFNAEDGRHMYQPCLPQILDVLNTLTEGNSADYTSFNWTSKFMQSTTTAYDRQGRLMSQMGFQPEHIVDAELLKSRGDNHTEVNDYGMPEVALETEFEDAIVSAKEKNQRLFLSHLTSTTHDPFGIPDSEGYISYSGDADWDVLSHYINAVGYVDRWLGKILGILDAQGIANETLVVFVGDHGLSITELGSRTPYNNPHVGNFHVPLVISHPNLPHVDVDDAVTSLQILPTLLDLLLESGSLAKRQRQAAVDLLGNFEGQSLLRPQRAFSRATGRGNWQFTVMNPGGSYLSVRDARKSYWRLIVPLRDSYEWRFSDLSKDMHERAPFITFHLDDMYEMMEQEYGQEGVEWAREAATTASWWAEENKRRWRYRQ